MADLKKFVCIVCPLGCDIEVESIEETLLFKGNKCKKGEEFAKEELEAPKRVLTTTVKVKGGVIKALPVKSDKPILKNQIFEVLKILALLEVEVPIKIYDIILKNVLNKDVNIIATRSIKKEE